MYKEIDVVTIGELLIDFTPSGKSDNNMDLYECNPGGAPANVSVTVVRQGGTSAFIGKVGDDSFGRFLKSTLEENGVISSGVVTDKTAGTTLAFVSLDETGDRSFSFYRNPGADILLKQDEVDLELIKTAKVLLFGSVSLTADPSRQAVQSTVKFARENGVKIAYDPNLRPLLWNSLEEAKTVITDMITGVDILKLSDEELEFILGESDPEQGTQRLYDLYKTPYIFVTMGAKGSFYRHKDISGHVPTRSVDVVDTTGSGDAFTGAIINKLGQLEPKEFENLSKERLEGFVRFANASGTLTATKRGAIPSIPTTLEIERFLG